MTCPLQLDPTTHAARLAQAELKLTNCRRELERLKGDHGRIQGMKPPAGVEVGP